MARPRKRQTTDDDGWGELVRVLRTPAVTEAKLSEGQNDDYWNAFANLYSLACGVTAELVSHGIVPAELLVALSKVSRPGPRQERVTP